MNKKFLPQILTHLSVVARMVHQGKHKQLLELNPEIL